MFLQGQHVIVRKLKRTDLLEMTQWRPFDDPLLADANWPQRSLGDLNIWYSRFSDDPRRLLCAVTDRAGRIIGSITLRERNGRRSARLANSHPPGGDLPSASGFAAVARSTAAGGASRFFSHHRL